MSRQKQMYIVLDTETCPLVPSAEINTKNMWVYDLGFAVVDRYGTVYETHSYVISDIFQSETELMKSAYYADKIPQYLIDLQNGTREMVSFYTARKALIDTMKKYHTNVVIAHNARFDYGTLQNTQRWLTKSKYRYFFPKSTEIWDTMKMANDTICKQKKYRKFCEENGLLTKNGQVRKTAEALYRFITNDTSFVENHTGLEDVMIEKEIFAKCNAMHQKMRRKLWEN